MISIETKYLGATNYRGSRIVATAPNGARAIVDYNDAYNSEKAHWQAAKALIKKHYKPEYLRHPTELLCGGTRRGYVFTFVGGTVYTLDGGNDETI